MPDIVLVAGMFLAGIAELALFAPNVGDTVAQQARNSNINFRELKVYRNFVETSFTR